MSNLNDLAHEAIFEQLAEMRSKFDRSKRPDEFTAREYMERFKIVSQRAAYSELQTLVNDGKVMRRESGRFVFYRLCQ